MAERTRERERTTMANVQRNNEFRNDLEDLMPMQQQQSPGEGNNAAEIEAAARFRAPKWLKGLFPIPWSSTDGCSKLIQHGKNCCFFYPLGYCRDTDIINGFCVFHLRAIFNLIYQTDCTYIMNADGKPTMSQRTACYVAEPQIINDEYTAVFPIVELMPNEVRLENIKMHNLLRHLQMHGTQNWERIYANHVNYLYRMFTLFSPEQTAKTPIESRVDQLASTQLLMHWNLWNDYYSKIIVDNMVDLYPFYVPDESRDDVEPLPSNKCTTLTQMIIRLFTPPYTNYNSSRFFSTPANYGFVGKAHLVYSNNMCSIGTHCTKGNIMCIGNIAMLNMIRNDSSCRNNSIHYKRNTECEENFCVPARINLNAPSLNVNVVADSRGGPVTNPAQA